ncbi:hypothetical protein BCV70DRAFT_197052 [Testicularia cyperi]|uniref:Uncharacterized protein n=1 Tax=Testicularia cyperi TaxID=1882483 RepID=A0A317XZT8_9BASI|nr:hypothetical protein BCV70DRAFT_197052 [Testicularia cyperi]
MLPYISPSLRLLRPLLPLGVLARFLVIAISIAWSTADPAGFDRCKLRREEGASTNKALAAIVPRLLNPPAADRAGRNKTFRVHSSEESATVTTSCLVPISLPIERGPPELHRQSRRSDLARSTGIVAWQAKFSMWLEAVSC